jgi:hypothetical protein
MTPRATSSAPERLPPRTLRAASAPLEPVVLGLGEEVAEVPGEVADGGTVFPKPVFEVDGAGLVERGVTLAVPLALPDAEPVVETDLDVGVELAPVTVVETVADTAPMEKELLVVNTVLISSMATNSIV